MSIQLTRYLYFLDECFYSLLMALINKKSFEEVLFWAGEIYYSGFEKELWNHLWKIYYDFYAIRYPKFEKKINKMSKEWENQKNINNIIYIINLLYYSKVTYNVFIMRMLDVISPNYVYMGRLTISTLFRCSNYVSMTLSTISNVEIVCIFFEARFARRLK